MQTAEDIEDLKAERANILGEVQNHCPFGCTKGELDEYGYCSHLVGFTNDGKTVETIQPWKRWDNHKGEWVASGDKFVSGSRKQGHVHPVQPTDTLVNPVVEQVVEGIKRKVAAWVSSRVYREEEAPSNDGPSTTVMCDECGDEFKNANGLRLHKRAKHPVMAEIS